MYFYTRELIYRLSYWVLCFSFCILIIFYNITLVLLVESYSFIKLYNTKFILINITDLFDIIWLTCIQNAFLFSYIYFHYQIMVFNKSSWYIYQHIFKNALYKFINLLLLLCFLFFYLYFLPSILKFLTQWDIINFSDLLNVEFELSLLNYIKWILCIKFYFIIYIYFFFIILFKIFYFIKMKLFYINYKNYKKQIIFSIISISYLLAPPDIYLQFILFVIDLSLLEIVYFCVCFKVINM
nr:Sec-independent protein translocase component TatC [Hypnea sp.]